MLNFKTDVDAIKTTTFTLYKTRTDSSIGLKCNPIQKSSFF